MIISFRYMSSADKSEVLAAEAASFDPAWSEAEFRRRLAQGGCVGLVATPPGGWAETAPVAGYAVYRVQSESLELLRIAVAPRYRRRGVGRALLRRLAGGLRHHNRGVISLAVPDDDLAAHLWLRACGWRAEGIEGGCYRFAYRVPAAEGVACGG